jgi:hypothetical protein
MLKIEFLDIALKIKLAIKQKSKKAVNVLF